MIVTVFGFFSYSFIRHCSPQHSDLPSGPVFFSQVSLNHGLPLEPSMMDAGWQVFSLVR